MTEKEKRIISDVAFTIIYYNVSGYPLTTFEIWKHLIKCRIKQGRREFKRIEYQDSKGASCSLFEVTQALRSKEIEENFSCLDSFWVIKGNEVLIRQRVKKQKIAISKIKRLQKWVSLATLVPFLRGIFISGTLAMKRASVSSDWDVLIVTKKDRIWIGRLFITGFFQLFGKRRHHDKIQDRFCLNHFLTEGGLILEESGLYSASELMFMIPVFGRDVFDRFIQLNEAQIKKFKPNYEREELNDLFLIKENGPLSWIRRGLEWLLEATFLADGLNWICKKVMIAKIKNNPKTYLDGADIRYNDQALIFLPQPRRGIILERAEALFEKKLGAKQL